MRITLDIDTSNIKAIALVNYLKTFRPAKPGPI